MTEHPTEPVDYAPTLSALSKAAYIVLAVLAVATVVLLWVYALGWELRDLVILVLIGWVLWLHLTRARGDERTAELRADVDELGDNHRAVVVHLTGQESASSGRHSDGQPQTYRARSLPPRYPEGRP